MRQALALPWTFTAYTGAWPLAHQSRARAPPGLPRLILSHPVRALLNAPISMQADRTRAIARTVVTTPEGQEGFDRSRLARHTSPQHRRAGRLGLAGGPPFRRLRHPWLCKFQPGEKPGHRCAVAVGDKLNHHLVQGHTVEGSR